MKVWKFRQYRNDGSGGREERTHRYIAPARSASYRFRREPLPVCSCCGDRYCGWSIHELREWEMAALDFSREIVGYGPGRRYPDPLLCHQRGRFYRMARAGEIECVPSARAAMSAPLLAWEAWLEAEA